MLNRTVCCSPCSQFSQGASELHLKSDGLVSLTFGRRSGKLLWFLPEQPMAARRSNKEDKALQWFCIFTDDSLNLLSRKTAASLRWKRWKDHWRGRPQVSTLRYWRTSVVIHCAVYWALKPRRLNWVSSMSSSPVVHLANPYSRWETHGGSAAIDQALHWCSFYLLFFFICFNTTFLASLFLSYFFFFLPFECPISLPLPYTSLSLFWLQNVSLSLYLDVPLPPWFLSLYLTSFFLLLKDRFEKVLQDSSALYSGCFLISLMSDKTASGSYIQTCLYKHFIYM